MDIVVDIDGTLADLTHRLHHIQGKKDWNAFFDACGDDKPITKVIRMVHTLRTGRPGPGRGVRLIFCSGRPERTRETTTTWLADQYFPVRVPGFEKQTVGIFPLYMRADGDFREDSIVKRELLMAIRAAGYHPELAIDDRKRVVDMWRSEGLLCAQVAEGEF
jgi:hypothetical protein